MTYYSGVPNSQTRLTINAAEKKSQMFYYLLLLLDLRQFLLRVLESMTF